MDELSRWLVPAKSHASLRGKREKPLAQPYLALSGIDQIYEIGEPSLLAGVDQQNR